MIGFLVNIAVPLIVFGTVYAFLVMVVRRFSREERLRFSVRQIFLATTLVAVVCGVLRHFSNEYYWQLNALNEVLAAHPEIEEIRIMGNEDIWYEVEAVYFSIDGGKWFTIEIPHGAGRREISRILETTLENQ